MDKLFGKAVDKVLGDDDSQGELSEQSIAITVNIK
jgi:hypothetical protein